MDYRYIKVCLTFLLGLLFLFNYVQATPIQSRELVPSENALQATSPPIAAVSSSGAGTLIERAKKKKSCRKSKKGICKRSVTSLLRRNLVAIWNATLGKVTTGQTKIFKVDYTRSSSYAASECTGCTVVVMINGKEILIGHYPEEVASGKTIESKTLTQQHIVAPLEKGMLMYTESDDTRTWIIHSSRETTPVGMSLIKSLITDNACCLASNIATSKYAATSGIGFKDHPNGKVAVTTTPRTGGGVKITLYNQRDTAYWTQNYDAQGNPC